jgi:transcriptional regulator with XRE-family HTH domain
MYSTQFLPDVGACYAVSVVRGSPNPKHFGLALRLRKARKQTGLTGMALAQQAGVSDAIVRYLETDQRLPTVGTIARLAAALGMSAAWLAFEVGEQSSEGIPASCDGMAERLQTARTDRGHTRTDLARLAALNPGSIAKIESGGQAGVDTVEQIAKALRVSPAWLAYGVGQRELPQRRAARRAAAE